MSRPLRVCSVPSIEHDYVRRVTDCRGVQVVEPAGRVDPAAPWRPSAALRPGWAAAHAGAVDAVHVHFGYEHLRPAELERWVDELRAAGIALVVTVHDLTNPHLIDQRPHWANLAVLCARADAVVTLTPGAAREIAARWGRPATVIPHPHQFALELVGRRVRPRHLGGATVVGLTLRSPRANVDAGAALELLEPLSDRGVSVRVLADRARLAAADPGIATRLDDGEQAGRWEVRAADGRVAENELWEFISGLDALLLPYRWGSHSGWIESCRDVGTDVLAPAGPGFWCEQGPCWPIDLDDPAGFAEVVDAVADRPAALLSAAERQSEAAGIASRHADIYAEATRHAAAN